MMCYLDPGEKLSALREYNAEIESSELSAEESRALADEYYRGVRERLGLPQVRDFTDYPVANESEAAVIYDIIDGSEDPLHREAKIARIGQWLQFECDRDACDNVYDLAQAFTEYEEVAQ